MPLDRHRHSPAPVSAPLSGSESGHRRTERLLATAAFVTALGNNVQLIVGALLTLNADHTMMAVGWLFVAVAAPQALLSPLCGRLADRADRRRLWIGCDSASALLALALPVWLGLGGAQTAGVYLSNFALALVSALFMPASNALVKERIRPQRLRHFNANYEMAMQAGMLLSATVGGLAVQAFGAQALLIFNAGTFAVSALCVMAIGRATSTAVQASDGTARADAATQVHVRAAAGAPRVPLARLIVLYAQGSIVVTVFNALLPVLVLGELHHGTGAYGLLDALGSLGFLFATGAYRVLSRRADDRRIAVFGFLLCTVLLVAQSLDGLVSLAVGVPVGAFCFGQARIASRNLLMGTVDTARAGHAFGLANGGSLAATAAVMPLVAAVTDHTDARWGFGTIASISALTVLAAALPLGRRLTGEPAAEPLPAASLAAGVTYAAEP